MKKGISFIGGEGPTAEKCRKLAEDAALIAAADSGLILAEAALLRPDIIAGDMDSIDNKERLKKYSAESVFTFPVDKDATDTEIVIDLLRKKGCDEIIIAGGGGAALRTYSP